MLTQIAALFALVECQSQPSTILSPSRGRAYKALQGERGDNGVAQLVSLDRYRSTKNSDTESPKLKTAKGNKRRVDICFDRQEFGILMNLYSQQVALGEWKDYALDTSPGIAIFSIFRHAAEAPLYTVCKLVHPSGRGRQYAVFQGQKRLKLANTLHEAVHVFEGRVGTWITHR